LLRLCETQPTVKPGGKSRKHSLSGPGKRPFCEHFFQRSHKENAMNATLRTLLVTAIAGALSIVALPSRAAAQESGFQDAGAKIRGDAYWPGRATSRYVESARNYAQEVQTFVAKTPKPEPSVVKEINTELSRYLAAAKTHLTAMKKDFAADKETVTAVEGLEKELATAVEHHKAMISCCENEKFDKIATMKCCTDLVKDLDKIHGEHVALMQKLTSNYSASPGTK